MKLGIYTNLKKDINADIAKKLRDILVKKNIEYKVCDNAADFFSSNEVVDFDTLIANVDFIIAFGGDGTMLKIVSMCNGHSIPILGVNLGKIGFLTEVSKDNLMQAVEGLMSNHYTIESRTLLKATYKDQDVYALNEILLGNKSSSHIAVVSIKIDNSYATTVRGDGVMVATPTGSTAYSLACNGPILSPNVDALIVNTVCPHSLHSVPMVVRDDSEIVLSSENSDMRLIADGKITINFDEKAQLVIKKAENEALFIRMNNENFYHKLLKKLSNWGD